MLFEPSVRVEKRAALVSPPAIQPRSISVPETFSPLEDEMRARKEPTESRRGRSESGSVIVLSAVMLTVLFGVMGLAIEVGAIYSVKRKMQTAADAGAKAGAIEIWNSTGNWA